MSQDAGVSKGGVPEHMLISADSALVSPECVQAVGGDANRALIFLLVHRHGGRGWWRCTHKEMSRRTGLSLHRAKKALGALESAGLVEVRRVAVENRPSVVSYRISGAN